MKRRARILVWAVLLVSCLRAGAAWAQLQALWSGERLRAGQPANLFARWEAQEPFHGVELEVPADWSVHQAWAVRTGRPPAVLRIDTLAQGRFYLQPAQPIREALMLCITVTPAGSGLAFWQLTPLAPANISSKHPVPRPASTQRRPLFVQSADTENPRNYVLEVQTGARPLQITDSLLHWLDLKHPFTLALWLKSTTRNAVVLSTWSGDEQQSYPLELVLDAAGFLRAYRGRPGLHQALITSRPVADGSWHHITLTYDPRSGWSHLYLDGLAADSLFAPDVLPINPPSMLTIGGRPGQRATSFAGYLDMLVLDRRVWSASWTRRVYRQPDPPVEGLRLDFEAASFQAGHGLSRRRADLFFFEPLRQLRVLRADEEHVLLSWICTDQQTQAFVVERSIDGRTFTTIAQLPAACEGLPYRFRDPAPPSAPVLYYRIQQKFEDDILYPSAVLKLGLGPVQPSRALLLGNFPNPFQGRTTIQYELHEPMPVRLSIWDLSGHEVRVLIDALQPAGQYTLIFDAADLPSGTYFLRLETPEGVQTHKMILVR